MDIAAFRRLAGRFPDLAFVKKVRVEEPPAEKSLATSCRTAGFERFGALGKCEGVKGWIRPLASDVVRMSEMTANASACGTCVIPTEFGGSVVLVQDMEFKAPGWAGSQQSWTGCRRHGILDALDRAVPGGLPVRLLTDGYAVVVVAHKTPDGRTAGAFVMNMGTGETPPLAPFGVAAVIAASAGVETFQNPVIAEDWPDPAIWRGTDGMFYSVATGLMTVRASRNLMTGRTSGNGR